MLGKVLATLYERDLRKLIEEVNLFQQEEDLWKTAGSVKNSSGNLALHIIGGMNYHIGTNIAHTGYVRDRPGEFALKGVPRQEIVTRLEALILLTKNTLNGLTDAQLEAEYPVVFDDAKNSNSYVLVRLLAHLGYHLGQVNYLRRILE
ncbi:MAG TPA: DinB family protein [Puia sp.]|nr:DinB family protein [Puia sp.]